MNSLTLPRPDDWHLHLRDDDALRAVVGFTARVFGRAIVMPNLKPPVTSVAAALAYRDRIVAALPAGSRFEPLMTLYLTDTTTPHDVAAVAATLGVVAFKLYPAGATTNADAGVTAMHHVDAAVAAMADHGVPLLVHAEVNDPTVDVFDREAVFLDTVLGPLLDRHPTLRCVVEHVTTAEGVAFVRAGGSRVAATLTPQHLLLNRNALFAGGLRPHHYCLPVLKRERHRIALLEAATSGEPSFFLGTDSAPHARGAKESACGCAGCFTAPHALPLYARAFELAGALDRLPDFASRFGPAFYGLPVNDDTVTLVRDDTLVPEALPFGDATIIPLFAGERLVWRVLDA